MMKRKIKKLIRDPKLFFKDMYFKHSTRLGYHAPAFKTCRNRYTVVSAIYNVEKYLPAFFKSIKKQTVDFKKYIHLICVDDGSTDSSAAIIKKWQKKYPENITYLHKENGGQASARNLGIQYCQTEWVTFIDPDDFVSADYFYRVDQVIHKHHGLKMVSCPFIFYFENEKKYKDSHPLKYRFGDTDRIIPLQEMKNNIQLSVNSAFFRLQTIKQYNIRFPAIKPNFEDAKFVGDYLIAPSKNNRVAFISGASYFYRKRSDQSSSLDGAWKNPLLYTQVLSEGCLKLLQTSEQRLGNVPRYIQNMVLYHLSWYFKYLLNNDTPLNILSTKEKAEFKRLLHRIFKYIDADTIMDFNLAGIWFFQKVAWLGTLKKMHPFFQITYIEKLDREKGQVSIFYFVKDTHTTELITLQGKPIQPLHEKFTRYDCAGEPYVYERRLWLPYDENNSKAIYRIYINGKEARISLSGKQHKNGLPTYCLSRDLPIKTYTENKDYWILMDRDTQADDNAEHLYRFIRHHDPEQKIFFALRKSSHDWDRLQKEGFHLLDFGSPQFEDTLKQSSKIISSHADEYIVNYFGDNFELSKKFVFLQHGITQNDLSSWMNSKKTMACMITATYDEYAAIAGNKSKYKMTDKEVVLTGFPRHDNLLVGNKKDEKIILIMPTWRKNIIGNVVKKSNRRESNQQFMQSNYARSWQSFLNHQKLEDMAQKYGYQVIFAPHANIEPYLNDFKLPEYISIWRARDSSIQELFQKASLMITDYSSVAFEMGVLSKQVLYYQFDKEEFFSDGHVFKPGYFRYEQHGFGPVVYEETDVLNELEKLLKNNAVPIEPYFERIQNTFPFRDGKNCQRVYDAIVALDHK